MDKISISLLTFFISGFIGLPVWAQNDAVDAAAVFRSAKTLQETLLDAKDDELVTALAELKLMVEEGNRHLLNRKVKKAKRLAERVSAQMSLVKLLQKVAELKVRLLELQQNMDKLKEEKAFLKEKHRRLVMNRDGRAYSGAYPAPDQQQESTP